MAVTLFILLQTAANDLMVKLMDRTDKIMTDYLWDKGFRAPKDVLWDDMLGIAVALGAVFSLILVGKIAYEAMVLKEKIDFMKLWKPIAIVFVLSNWWAVTYGIYGLAQPFEDYFRAGFEKRNAKVAALQNQRLAAVRQLYAQTDEKAAEAATGEEVERMALTRDDTQNYVEDKGEQREEDNDILISSFGNVYYDMSVAPLDDNGIPEPKLDATAEVQTVKVQNFIESIILWIAEGIWTCMVTVLFLTRAYFMVVLVMFGPIYMAVSILPAWEDAWKNWLERYIFVNFVGTVAFIALTFVLVIMEHGVKTDVDSYTEIVNSDPEWYNWLWHCITSFAASIGIYVTTLFVGVGVMATVFELATFVFPTQALRGLSSFFSGVWNKTEDMTVKAGDKIAKKAVKAMANAGGAVTGAVVTHVIDKATEEAEGSLHENAPMGPEGEMRNGRTTGEFEGRSNSYEDHRDSSTDSTADKSTYSAHRWADRMWQEKIAMDKQNRQQWMNARMKAAGQDLDELLKAQSEGRMDEFMKNRSLRLAENRILYEIMLTGHAGLHLFAGDRKAREAFLKKHGLYDAVSLSEKMQDKAENMKPGNSAFKQNVRNKRFASAAELDRHIAEKVRDILAARGIHEGGFSVGMEDGMPSFNRTHPEGTRRPAPGDRGFENVNDQMQRGWFRRMSANTQNRQMLMRTLEAYEMALAEGRGDEFIRDMKRFGIQGMMGNEPMADMNPFAAADIRDAEYRSIWDELQDTETLRKINQALDDIERIQTDEDTDASDDINI